MDSELTSVRPASTEKERYAEMDGMEKEFRRELVLIDEINESLDLINTTPDTGFCAFIQSRRMRLCWLFLFGLICMTVGILVVYYGSLPSNEPCERIFRRTFKSSATFGSQPQSIAAADLNNDNQTDIVFLNIGAHSFGILFSNSTNGTFAKQQSYTTRDNSLPSSIAIADLDGDTYKDLIITKYGQNSLTIYLNDQGRNFIESKNISLGSSRPIFVRTGHLNNDNRIDIVVINYGTNTIGVILSKNNISFEEIDLYSTGYDSNPVSLAIGDLNNDKYLDIVVCNLGTNNIGIFYGKGNGKFEDQTIYSTDHQSQPTSVEIIDFNGDTYLDIIVSNNGTNNIGIFLNNRNGSFESQIKHSYSTRTYFQSLTCGDMNNDNHVDILLVDQYHNQFHVLLGDGNGSISLQTTYDGADGSEPYAIATQYFNDNNRLDVALTNFQTNEIVVLKDYSYEPSIRRKYYMYGTATYTASFILNDFNGDGLVDIVSYSKKDLFILFGQTDGLFGNARFFPIGTEPNVQSIANGDLNNDNQSDVVIIDVNSNTIGIYLGDGKGNLNRIESYSTGQNSIPYSIAIKDINKDRKPDLIVANRGTSRISILFGFGNGSFTNDNSFSVGDNVLPVFVAVHDFNKDTNEDLIILLSYGHFLIYLGNGDGSFSYLSTYQSDYETESLLITVFDFNKDGYLDLFIADPLPNLIRIYTGGVDASFVSVAIDTGPSSRPYAAVLADMNGDEHADLVVSYMVQNGVAVLYGLGNGTFEYAEGFPTGDGTQPRGISVYDLNNDGKLEIITALIGQGSILVLTEYYQATFENRIHYSTGTPPRPYSANVADFNGNNQVDIIVANTGENQLQILLDFDINADKNKILYSLDADSYPRHVISCDYNQDGHADLVNVNTNLHSISAIQGYGNGSFGKQIQYSTGAKSYPYFVASKDLNNDSKIDLIVANQGSDNIGIYYSFNFKAFHDQKTYSPPQLESNPNGLVLNYFNNDRYLDIVVVQPLTKNLGILFGNEDGSFSQMQICYSFDANSSPQTMATKDLNGDSFADLVVTDISLNEIHILFGYGNGSFRLGYSYSTGDDSYPIGVDINHLNDDSLLDIVVVKSNTFEILIFLANTDGSFSPSGIYSTGDQSAPSSIHAIDLNSDSLIDLIVANTGQNNVGVFFGFRNGTYREQIIFPSGTDTQPVNTVVGDFNKDNQIDICTINWNSNSISILLGLGNEKFSSPISFTTGIGTFPTAAKTFDMNKDGHLDIVVATFGTSSVVVLYGLGDGTFLLGKPYSTGLDSGVWAVDIADFNKDSYVDIAVANSEGKNIGIFISDGFEPFGTLSTHNTGDGSQPHSIAIADCNNDQRMDIIVTAYGIDSIGIFLADQNGQYDEMLNYSMGINSAPYGITTADLNNDQNIDIIVTNSGTNEVVILLGYGNNSFVEGSRYSTGYSSTPYSVVVSDFNNDAQLDISIANYGTSNVLILYGLGDGRFTNQTSYGFGYQYNPASVVVSDLNNDKWMDMVVATFGTDHVETLVKMC